MTTKPAATEAEACVVKVKLMQSNKSTALASPETGFYTLSATDPYSDITFTITNTWNINKAGNNATFYIEYYDTARTVNKRYRKIIVSPKGKTKAEITAWNAALTACPTATGATCKLGTNTVR